MIIGTYTNVSARFSGNTNCFSSRLAQQSMAIKLSSLVDSWYIVTELPWEIFPNLISCVVIVCPYFFLLLFISLCDPSVAVQTDNEISDPCF